MRGLATPPGQFRRSFVPKERDLSWSYLGILVHAVTNLNSTPFPSSSHLPLPPFLPPSPISPPPLSSLPPPLSSDRCRHPKNRRTGHCRCSKLLKPCFENSDCCGGTGLSGGVGCTQPSGGSPTIVCCVLGNGPCKTTADCCSDLTCINKKCGDLRERRRSSVAQFRLVTRAIHTNMCARLAVSILAKPQMSCAYIASGWLRSRD